MSTHNICFHGELEKIIPELSPNTPPEQVPCSRYSLEASKEYHDICFHGKNNATFWLIQVPFLEL